MNEELAKEKLRTKSLLQRIDTLETRLEELRDTIKRMLSERNQ